MTKSKLLFVVAGVLIISCSKPSTTPDQSKLFGLASPIQLQRGENTILLRDYFPEDITIDSVRMDADLKIGFEVGHQTIQVFYPESGLPPLMNLTIFAEGLPYSILVKSPINKPHHFVYNDGKSHGDIRIKGMFNSWDASKLVLHKMEGSDEWHGDAFMRPGQYQYKYMVDGKEMNDPVNPQTVGNGMGGTNSLLVLEGVAVENQARLSTEKYEKEKIHIGGRNVSGVYAYWENFRLEAKRENNHWIIQIPPFATKQKRSHIRIFGYNEYGVSNDLLLPLEKGEILTDPTKLNNSDWHSSIMYFMMVDRFLDGDANNNHPLSDPAVLPNANYMGGDLKGVTQKIKDGYFSKLGINTIWISPITQNPLDAWGQFKDPDTKFSGYHGYWPISSSKVDYRFGNAEDLKELLATAHANGLSVLLDYVANHVHQQHPVYQQHKDWVTSLYLPDGSLNTERWDDHRLTTWFDTFMPSLNLMDQNVTEFMVDSAIYWIKEYDFDGFRHDATKHIPENFWRTLTREVKKESQKQHKYIYQIGETYGSHELINSYIGSGMLDGQFDFNLYDHALAVFASDKESFSRLTDALEASLNTYGSHHLMGNISGNQDKPRFISFADGSLNFDTPWLEYKRIGWKQNIGIKDSTGYDKLAMFNAFNLTIPGIPIVYYGDEIGLPGAGDPDNRRMMKFDNLNFRETALQAKVAQLTQLRMRNMALLYGDFTILENTDDFLVYERRYFDQAVVVMMNRSKQTKNYTHPSGEYFSMAPGAYIISSSIGNQRQTIP